MSLKHNPFDNSYKGKLIRRKQVFETPKLEELASEVGSSSIEFNQGQSSSINRGQSRSIEFNRVQSSSKKEVQSSSIEFNRVQIGSVNPNELSIGETNVLRWFQGKKLEDMTALFRAEECSAGTGLTREGTKTAVKRLKRKGFIDLIETRRGRYTAFSLYRITAKGESFLEKKSSNLAPLNWVQKGSKGFTNRVQIGSCSSSSNYIYNNTTTTEAPKTAEFSITIPDELAGRVSVQQLQGFLSSNQISQETLNDSLFGFAYDLKNGLVKSKTGNAISILIGALKQGGYISERYLSLKEKEIAEVTERVSKLKKMKEQMKAQNLVAEFENFIKEFPEEAEKIKPSLDFIKDFEPNSVGYHLWIEEFKKQKCLDG